MSVHDALQTHQRLWNNPENVLEESIAGTVMMHQHLVYLNSCRAIVRSDHDKLNGKVGIIGGGVLIDGPMYAGFVGSGMLTAAVLSLHRQSLSIPTSNSILEVIDYMSKNIEPGMNGILLLVHDCPEYYLNFSLAKNKAESKGIPTKMVLVRDERSDKLNQRSSSPQSPSGLLWLYKIAGAMSEEGKTLEEIYNTCEEIIKSGNIFSIGVYVMKNFIDERHEIEISRGDRLSDREIKRFPIVSSPAKVVVENLVNYLVDSNHFPRSCELALMLDYFGGFSQLEVNIMLMELTHCLNQFQFDLKIIYAGMFHTSLETNGFHLSILNLSSNQTFFTYLSLPTAAFSWPKACIRNSEVAPKRTTNVEENTVSCENKHGKRFHNGKKVAKNLESFQFEMLMAAIEYACEALIACAQRIDLLDRPIILEEKCGTRLANTAGDIKSAIDKEQFAGLNLSHVISQISLIFEQCAEDPQAELYRLFFSTISKAVEDRKSLIDAFVKALHVVNTVAKNTKFANTLLVAETAFRNAYSDEDDETMIHALEKAVVAAQEQTSHITIETGRITGDIDETDYGYTGLAGAHAIGVWMRGAYEGMKLMYSRQSFQKVATHLTSATSDDSMSTSVKNPKLSKN